MKLKTFRLTLGQTINLGNFNNFRYEVSGEIEIAESDVPEDEIADLKEFLREQARAIKSKNENAGDPQ